MCRRTARKFPVKEKQNNLIYTGSSYDFSRIHALPQYIPPFIIRRSCWCAATQFPHTHTSKHLSPISCCCLYGCVCACVVLFRRWLNRWANWGTALTHSKFSLIHFFRLRWVCSTRWAGSDVNMVERNEHTSAFTGWWLALFLLPLFFSLFRFHPAASHYLSLSFQLGHCDRLNAFQNATLYMLSSLSWPPISVDV